MWFSQVNFISVGAKRHTILVVSVCAEPISAGIYSVEDDNNSPNKFKMQDLSLLCSHI